MSLLLLAPQLPPSLGRKHGAYRTEQAPCPVPALTSVPSVLSVSTLGRSPSGPRPRSSLWCSTPARPTSGCPLSTARVTPAVSDPRGSDPGHSAHSGGGQWALLGGRRACFDSPSLLVPRLPAQPSQMATDWKVCRPRGECKAAAGDEGGLRFVLSLSGAQASCLLSWVLSFPFYIMAFLPQARGCWANKVRRPLTDEKTHLIYVII